MMNIAEVLEMKVDEALEFFKYILWCKHNDIYETSDFNITEFKPVPVTSVENKPKKNMINDIRDNMSRIDFWNFDTLTHYSTNSKSN